MHRMMRCLPWPCALIACAAFAAPPAQPATPDFLAWQVPRGYVEGKNDAPLERIYYFGKQDATNWNERLRVGTAQLAPGQTLTAWFATLRAAAKSDCAGLVAQPGPSGTQDGLPNLYEMWHCPKSRVDGHGAVSVFRLIDAGNRLWLLTAEGRYPAFAAGKTPLTKVQLARWTAFERSAEVCAGNSAPVCLGDAETLRDAPTAPMSPQETTLAQRAQTLGRELHRQDALAWRAGDVLGAAKLKGISGWVAMPRSDDEGNVYFLRGALDHPELAWVVAFAHGRKPEVRAGTPAELTQDLMLRFRARQTALAEQTKPCTGALDTAVLRDPRGGGWQVYTLATSPDPDVIWIGGSTRYVLLPDATVIVNVTASARGCLSIHRKDASGRAIGNLVLTEQQAAVPDEMLVMRQLAADLPFVVGTRDAVWRIRDGRIEKIAPRATERMTITP